MEKIDFRPITDIINIFRFSGYDVRGIEFVGSRIDIIIDEYALRPPVLEHLIRSYDFRLISTHIDNQDLFVIQYTPKSEE